jgi:outer membrane protein TolC
MMDRSHNQKWVRLCLACLGSLVILAGCGPKNYKRDADERVYNIIDNKWKPEFGSKANYRISDVTPDPNAIQIKNAIPASGTLTLPHALALATAHNREYQTQKELLYTSALDLRLVRHGYEWQLFGGGSGLYRKEGRDEAIENEANVGVNRLLGVGTQLSTQIAAGWLDVIAGKGNDHLFSVFSAAIAQPLLRGSDPAIVLESLTQAERDTLYQIRDFNRFRKTFVVAVASEYFRAIGLYDVVKNTQEYRDVLSALHGKVTKLANAGLLPRFEADQVQQEALKASDALVIAMKEYEQALDQLKITLALPVTTEFRMDVGLLDVLKARGIPYPDVVVSTAMDTALSRRLDIANRADAVLDAQRAVYVAADSLRADLRLVGAVDLANDPDGHKVKAGALVDLPFDRVAEQNVYRKALISLDHRRRDYDLLADKIRLEIRTAHRKLVETAERYQILSKAQETALIRLGRTSALLQYARVSSRRVLNAQEDLYDARNDATKALIDYVVATLEFYRDTEVLQVRPDGLWEAEGLKIPVARDGPVAVRSETNR